MIGLIKKLRAGLVLLPASGNRGERSRASLLKSEGINVSYSAISTPGSAVIKKVGLDFYIKVIAHWLVKVHWCYGRQYRVQDLDVCINGLSYHLRRSKVRSGNDFSLYSVLQSILAENPLYDRCILLTVMRDCFKEKPRVRQSLSDHLTSLTLDWHLASGIWHRYQKETARSLTRCCKLS